jgi:hypothetical protein
MRNNLILAAIAISATATAQYGTFDKKAVDPQKAPPRSCCAMPRIHPSTMTF